MTGRKMRRLFAGSHLMLLTALLAILHGCGDDEPTEPTGGSREPPPGLSRCTVLDLAPPTFCGFVEVFEDRDAEAGRKLSLRVVVAGATEGDRLPDPLIYFEGGPGGSSVDAAPRIVGSLPEIRQRRDMVFVDQRGTGDSAPLRCTGAPADGAASLFGTLFPPDDVEECRTRLSRSARLELYATHVAADDVAQVLTELGYSTVNLLGTSYGTRLALVFLRRHPERVRSAVVNSVAPPDVSVHLHGAANADASLEALLTACEATPQCRNTYPDARGALEELLARFDQGPQQVQVGVDGRPVTVSFTRGDFGYAVRGLLYGPRSDQLLSWLVEARQTGGWSGFPGYYAARAGRVFSSVATGMHLSVFCTEDIPFATEAEIQALTQGTVMGAALIRRYQAACEQWPRGELPQNYRTPVRVDRPVLVISGEWDPVTPAAWGQSTADALPDAVHLVVPRSGHVPFVTCVREAMISLYRNASTAGLEGSCQGS